MNGIIDLSRLTPPDAVEVIDFEQLLAEVKAELVACFPGDEQEAVSQALALESSMLSITCQLMTYREIVLRQRINEGVRATFLAMAKGADLDVKAADYGVTRHVVNPGDPAAIPPREPEYESDEALRERAWLSMQAMSVAGPYGAYRYHARSASPEVLDAQPYGPEDHSLPGEVHVYVLSCTGDGAADDALIETVRAALTDTETRPLTDFVTVRSAQIVPYTVAAVLHIQPGPDARSVKEAAMLAMQKYVDSVHRIGHTVAESGLFRALHQSGVERVEMSTPLGNLDGRLGVAYYCTDITIETSTRE
ncbi:baseplate assembly protein [Serratia marcescens]|uniref:baseplate assembly protein n=1 Tax=Serratia marcescens TaxID=615 RepID=UPI0009536189|nr:baseplate J/gp47 family protein [Serratia marcescens]